MSYVAKHSKQRKTTKLVKLQWIASIWCQNGQKSQNYKRNQITINLHRFDVKTIKNVEARRKTFKTTQNYKTDQITMNCIDLMSKRSNIAKLQKQSNKDQFASIWRQNDLKCWVTSQNILNNTKLQNWSNYNELHRFDVKTVKNRKTTKGIKLRSICIDLTSKRSKMLSNVSKHSKQRKTTKLIKLQWIASIWCQNGQKSQNYERDQIIMHCIDLTSKRSKKLSYVPKLQKQSNSYQFASIWRQNDQKCWVTSQNILNNAKLQNWSNYNELHRFDVKTIKNRKTTNWSNYNEWHRFDVKTIKTTQNYKSDQIITNCIDLTSKRSKLLS